MSLNFNKKEQEYGYLAVGNEENNFGVLNEKAHNYFRQIQRIIYNKHNDGDKDQKRLMVGAQGCLERLESILILSNRLDVYNKSVCNQQHPSPGSFVGFKITNAMFDFESILFHSRALLDRITFFISKQIYNQDCDKPNKIINVLNNFVKNDNRASQAIQIVDDSMPAFLGLIIDNDNEKSLRSHLIHKSTIGENTTCVFTIHSAPGNKVLRFDYEVKGYPIIGSSWELSKFIPFYSLNLLGIYIGCDKTIALHDCIPIWKNNLIHFSNLIDETESGPKFSTVKMNPSGFEVNTSFLKPSILS